MDRRCVRNESVFQARGRAGARGIRPAGFRFPPSLRLGWVSSPRASHPNSSVEASILAHSASAGLSHAVTVSTASSVFGSRKFISLEVLSSPGRTDPRMDACPITLPSNVVFPDRHESRLFCNQQLTVICSRIHRGPAKKRSAKTAGIASFARGQASRQVDARMKPIETSRTLTRNQTMNGVRVLLCALPRIFTCKVRASSVGF
jgi:hypothetical protein